MSQRSGRKREVSLIHRANRAAAVGRLMLGEFNTWQEFLEADILDIEDLPRRQLKSGLYDVKERLSPTIKYFCSKNFRGMNEKKLSLLYEDIKAFRGLEIPLKEFEKKYAPVKREVLKGNPIHLTVVISLWGLQFRFPEAELANDLASAIKIANETHEQMRGYKRKPHRLLEEDRSLIALLVRQNNFAARSIILCSFNLMEAYLNGLAWDYVQTHDMTQLSNTKRKLLEDTNNVSIREKLLKYPRIIADENLWQEPDQDFDEFIDMLKPFRDSLVHPSPFATHTRSGSYDKLRMFYRIDYENGIFTAKLLVKLLKRIDIHIHKSVDSFPDWLKQLDSHIKETT